MRFILLMLTVLMLSVISSCNRMSSKAYGKPGSLHNYWLMDYHFNNCSLDTTDFIAIPESGSFIQADFFSNRNRIYKGNSKIFVLFIEKPEEVIVMQENIEFNEIFIKNGSYIDKNGKYVSWNSSHLNDKNNQKLKNRVETKIKHVLDSLCAHST